MIAAEKPEDKLELQLRTTEAEKPEDQLELQMTVAAAPAYGPGAKAIEQSSQCSLVPGRAGE